ncbi:YggS family pyridoxal phosphate-dependent enzyme [Gloeothece verrucosa]|uniref:Pyridoxal phosphate homeostasis protein n=1 Tax=Gloeothece verrucosa (strain PCC 7822) TaxID=497965 RepID=E0UF55_GLOV7|nr:YggS family pyridoxal phosphate-dependent enzyme [Gloeothece verrucosa]ADN14307.1 alanine racemase domain protein [Gloeothece verrucosa PCC 7822]
MTIAQRIDQIRSFIPSHVRLIAVTKQVPTEAMREAYQAGIRDFAENRLQEALVKQEQLQDLPDLCWHFIGHLQSNKAKKVLESFEWIHSVDSLELLQRLDRLAKELSNVPRICLQVKVLPDPNKYGWPIPEFLQDIPQIEKCCQLKIQGLMTILPLGLNEAEIKAAFETTRKLALQVNGQSQLEIRELSMGMSDDYQWAVGEGATMIRLGRILFGERA